MRGCFSDDCHEINVTMGLGMVPALTVYTTEY